MFWHYQLHCIITVVIVIVIIDPTVHLCNTLLGTGKGRKTRISPGLALDGEGPPIIDNTVAADVFAEAT